MLNVNAMAAQDRAKDLWDLHCDLFILSGHMCGEAHVGPSKKSTLTLNRSHCEILLAFPRACNASK